MAAAFSGHLLNAFNSTPAQPSTSIVTSGAMSFDARMHGSPFSFGFIPLPNDSASAKQIATLQAKLNKKLGPEYISQRPGPGGGQKLTYAEGWKIINLANEVFGFNGWSSSIVNISTDFVDCIEESRRFNVGVTAIVRVTLRDGAYHEDVGYGMLENARSKGAALDKCKKEAITDALKRTLRNFGNLLGNCLYDKSYAQEIVKIKVPPPKLDKNELYRRPEFEETVPDAPPQPASRGQPVDLSAGCEEPRLKVEHENPQPETPITYVPRHLRQEMAAAPQRARAQVPARAPPLLATPPRPPAATTSGSNPIGAPVNQGPSLVEVPNSNGLVTPIQTPIQAQRPPSRAPPPRSAAVSPLARMQSAPECSISSVEPIPVNVPVSAESAGPVDDTDKDNCKLNDEDDGFPISTQDGVFFATVDLGDGDLGRPIDYDEGMGGLTMMETSMPEQGPGQVGDRAVSGSSARSTSGGPSNTGMRNEAQVHPVKPPSGNKTQGQPRSALSNGTLSASTSSTSSARIGPLVPAPTGGSHYQSKPPVQHHTPKPVMPACIRTSSTSQSTNALKRSADTMQTGATSTSTRPPLQGMGLAQRQQQRDAAVQRPSDNSEGNDLKRFKR